MGKSIAVFLAVCVIAAQSASLRDGDAQLERKKRSCSYCQEQQSIPPPPPPPPGPPRPPLPPPIFHTQQWSGYARSPDGRQQGVFSGAAAAASSANNDVQASGQAFSLTDAGTSSKGLGEQTQSTGYGGKSNFKESQFAYGSKSFDSHHGAQGGVVASGSQGSFGQQEQQQQQQQIQNGLQGFGQPNQNQQQSKSFGQQGLQQQSQGGFNSASQAEAQSLSNGFSGRGDQGQVEQFGKYNSGAGSGFSGRGDQGDVEKGKYNTGGNAAGFRDQGQEQQQVQSFGQGGFGSSGYGGHGNSQGSLHGALELASQGVQAAQQTGSGCTTCGKSSYALSNAKSHSGSAVAVSIGG